MKKTLAVLALSLTATFTLAACGGDENESAPQSAPTSAAPDSEATPEAPVKEPGDIKGTGYSLDKPVESWGDLGIEIKAPLDLAQGNKKTGESFNVVVIDAEGASLDNPALAGQVKTQLEAVGFSNIRDGGKAQLDGEDALVTISDQTQGETKLTSYQLYTIRDGKAYILTVGGFSEADATKWGQAVADSWAWA